MQHRKASPERQLLVLSDALTLSLEGFGAAKVRGRTGSELALLSLSLSLSPVPRPRSSSLSSCTVLDSPSLGVGSREAGVQQTHNHKAPHSLSARDQTFHTLCHLHPSPAVTSSFIHEKVRDPSRVTPSRRDSMTPGWPDPEADDLNHGP